MTRGLDPGRRVRAGLATLSCVMLLGSGALGDVRAETYRLESPGDSVVGVPFYFTARGKDTLLDIARQNNLGFDDMRNANRKVDMWMPGEGTEVLVPTLYVLPNADRNGIVINRPEKRLYYYPPRDPGEVRVYSISVGREGMSTPLGAYRIIEKKRDPSWTPGPNVRAAHAAYGDILPAVVPPGPENPLGRYAMRLSNPDYLIHGTSKPWGLGMEVSGGCIRMYPEGVEELFGLVSINTPVAIVDQPYKLGWRGEDLYLEVHIEDEGARRGARAVIPESVANAPGAFIDWGAVERAIEENAGVPQVVGGRRQSDSGSYLPMIF